jgi:hypothetical protein
MMVAGAGKAFDANGRLTDPKSREQLERLMEALRREIAMLARDRGVLAAAATG